MGSESDASCLPEGETAPEIENVKFEYEAQHFGFTPVTLLNGMFNTVCDLYRDALKEFCKICSEKYPNVLTEEELRCSRHTVSELIDKDICLMFDTLEHFLLHKVLSIPDNAVLPEDRCQLEKLSQDEQSALETQINETKKRIIAVKCANAIIDQHLKNADALQGTLDNVIEHLSTRETSLSQLGGKNLKDWISCYSEILKKHLKPEKNTAR